MPLTDLDGNPIADDQCPVHPHVVGACAICEDLLARQLGTAFRPAGL